jgi:hypothetical protein
LENKKEYIKFAEDHICKTLKETDADVSVTKYKLPNKVTPQWFLCVDGVLNVICYCPYCGKKLEGDNK